MHFRKPLATALAAAAALTLLATACDQSATDPAQTTEVSMESALMGGGMQFSDGAPAPAILGHLMHAAIDKIHHDLGADSAHAAADALKPLITAAHDAHQSGDTAAARAAMDAVRQAEAQIIINAFGTDVVTRTLDFANARIQNLNDRIAKANGNDNERPRLESLAASLNQILADANAAVAAGDNVTALLDAARIVEAMHIVNEHAMIGPRGTLPLDTTRVRRHP